MSAQPATDRHKRPANWSRRVFDNCFSCPSYNGRECEIVDGYLYPCVFKKLAEKNGKK